MRGGRGQDPQARSGCCCCCCGKVRRYGGSPCVGKVVNRGESMGQESERRARVRVRIWNKKEASVRDSSLPFPPPTHPHLNTEAGPARKCHPSRRRHPRHCPLSPGSRSPEPQPGRRPEHRGSRGDVEVGVDGLDLPPQGGGELGARRPSVSVSEWRGRKGVGMRRVWRRRKPGADEKGKEIEEKGDSAEAYEDGGVIISRSDF